jgi:hypothetical protein
MYSGGTLSASPGKVNNTMPYQAQLPLPLVVVIF